MTPAEDLPTAGLDTPVSDRARDAFHLHLDAIVEGTVARALAVLDDIEALGPQAPTILAAGTQFLVKGLQVAVTYGTVDLLADQLRWAADRLPHDGVAHEHTLHRMRLLAEAIEERLPAPVHAEVQPYVDWMIAYQQALIAESG